MDDKQRIQQEINNLTKERERIANEIGIASDIKSLRSSKVNLETECDSKKKSNKKIQDITEKLQAHQGLLRKEISNEEERYEDLKGGTAYECNELAKKQRELDDRLLKVNLLEANLNKKDGYLKDAHAQLKADQDELEQKQGLFYASCDDIEKDQDERETSIELRLKAVEKKEGCLKNKEERIKGNDSLLQEKIETLYKAQIKHTKDRTDILGGHKKLQEQRSLINKDNEKISGIISGLNADKKKLETKEQKIKEQQESLDCWEAELKVVDKRVKTLIAKHNLIKELG